MSDLDLLERPAKSPPQAAPGPNRADGYPRTNTRGEYRAFAPPVSAAEAEAAEAEAEAAIAAARAAAASSAVAGEVTAEGEAAPVEGGTGPVGWIVAGGAVLIIGGTALYAWHEASVAQAAKEKAQRARKAADKAKADEEKKLADAGGGKGPNNVNTTGDPCEVQPYKDNKCQDQDAHHIIVDMAMRYGTRDDAGSRLEDAPSLEDGDTICLDKAKHAEVHANLTVAFRAMRAASGGKTAPMNEIIDKCIEELEKAVPECKGQFEELRKKMKDKLGDQPGRIHPHTLKPGTPGYGQMKPFSVNK